MRFVGSVRHRHDIHVFKLPARFAAVAMGEEVVPPNFAARLDLASGRHSPTKECVETRHAHPGLRWLDMLEKRREPSDDFSRPEIFRHPTKFVERNARFFRTLFPWRRPDLFRRELAFAREQRTSTSRQVRK